MIAHSFFLRLLTFFAVVLAAGAVASQPVKTQYVEAELVAPRSAAAPGSSITVALRLKLAQGWHTYWRNPGEAGLPTTLKWSLPEGASAGDIQWPYPRAFPLGPLTNYGYEREVFHLVDIRVPASAAPGSTLPLAARADWLVCREVCIPEGADLRLSLPIATEPGAPTAWAQAIAGALSMVPKPLPVGWQATAQGSGSSVTLRIAPAGAQALDVAGSRFFPYREGRIEASGRQQARSDETAATLVLPVASQLVPGFDRLSGIVVNPSGWGSAGQAIEIDVPLVGSVVAGTPPATAAQAPAAGTLAAIGGAGAASTSGLALWAALASAFVGGMILNLMPCVFPVLSLKLLSFAQHDHREGRSLAPKGMAFAVGALATFWALAALLVALKAAGQQLGWGFQLQSPPVIASLAVLFFVIGLNLSGVFEFGQFAPGSIAAWQARKPMLDAFASGVLAVVVASPCTAPFMGAALGYALAQSAGVTFAVFTALGLGMAVPFVALSLFPGWRTLLPRPGPWMIRMRQLLAFPMYAAVIWLAWVLGVQLGVDAILRLASALLALALGIWLLRGLAGGRRAPVSLAAAAASFAAAVAIAWPVYSGALDGGAGESRSVSGSAPPGARASAVQAAADGPWQPWSAQRVADLNQSGKAVFVDFTAAWCVTCQVNKQLVLKRDAVIAAFRQHDVALMRADWTRQDPSITRALQSLGRNGVPVYALFRPGKPPLLLPEVLQESVIREALASL